MLEFNIFHLMPWSGAYAIYFFVIGIAAAMFFFSALSWYRPEFQTIRTQSFNISFILLAAGGLLLIGDLTQPLRFLNIMNPAYLNFSSPLAWGGLNLISFGIVSILYFLVMRKNDEGNSRKLAVVGALLALGLPIYTGFDLTVHQNRPVWNTPLMPVLFVALSLLSGAAVATFIAKGEKLLVMLRRFMLWSAGAVAAMLVSLLGTTAYGGSGSELTFMFMTSGSLGAIFVGLGILAGTVAPIAVLLTNSGKQQGGMMLAGALLLVGGMALRYSILISGQIVQTYY
ncbi:MAG: polysulfide reductase NrfD [Gammaproteobacteria bacterium]|nr:polysulfide reductase NrfD [Gammaproteobacteria bacterium]MBU1775719.1 polysulfide reductase NrfD [Gammaproteobacteria bacterium]MBU1969980.1 polysulfide reductase NrfD [Gammaproteobacteria bacterium]